MHNTSNKHMNKYTLGKCPLNDLIKSHQKTLLILLLWARFHPTRDSLKTIFTTRRNIPVSSPCSYKKGRKNYIKTSPPITTKQPIRHGHSPLFRGNIGGNKKFQYEKKTIRQKRNLSLLVVAAAVCAKFLPLFFVCLALPCVVRF